MRTLRQFIKEFLGSDWTLRGSERLVDPNLTIHKGMGIRPGASRGIMQDLKGDEQPKQPQAACVLLRKDGLFLGVSRKYDLEAFGMPGGKVDPGETPLQAAIRELYEETGLVLNNPKLLYVDSDREFETHTFTGDVTGNLRSTASGPQGFEGVVKWIDRETLIDGPFGWYNKRLFAKLGV